MEEESFANFVANFVAKREDTLAQDERWRNKMMRRLGDKFDHVDARFDRMNDKFEQLATTCVEIKESLRLQQGFVARDHPNTSLNGVGATPMQLQADKSLSK